MSLRPRTGLQHTTTFRYLIFISTVRHECFSKAMYPLYGMQNRCITRGRWDFRCGGSAQFLVRFLGFLTQFKTKVFRYWCLAQFAGFLQIISILGFQFLSTMMAPGFSEFSIQCIYGFSGFANEVTPCSRAKLTNYALKQ